LNCLRNDRDHIVQGGYKRALVRAGRWGSGIGGLRGLVGDGVWGSERDMFGIGGSGFQVGCGEVARVRRTSYLWSADMGWPLDKTGEGFVGTSESSGNPNRVQRGCREQCFE